MRIKIPNKELKEFEKLLTQGKSLTAIARENKYSYLTIRRRLIEIGVAVKGQHDHEKMDVDIDKIFNIDREQDKSDVKKLMIRFYEIRDKFKVGMKVKVDYGKTHLGQAYALRGHGVIKEKYKDFILIEKQGVDAAIKECINFRDILSGYVKVTVR